MWRLKSLASDRTPDTEFPSQSDGHSPPSEGHMASAMAGTVVPKHSILGHMVPVSGARWGQRQLCTADFGELLRGSILVKLGFFTVERISGQESVE